ncbi:MAG TPA: vWA domain-containing protein, partial [Thermoanaerobaculia bacterium]|nr:vWA domain-containing protein [Thermoanaerobaculia bacterium]
NRARFLVGVDGPKPVLVASGSRASRLTSLLTASGVDAVAAERPEWSLDALSNYSAVVLENIPSQDIGMSGMQTLASWVTHGGGALMLTGGQGSYGAGGYFKSPLDPLLPVSMELRREHRKINVSIVIALDRSGSMGMEASGGRTKMDLANLSAVQVLDLLSPQDELGVVAVDSSAHIIADLDPIEGRKDLRKNIMSVQSGGGGIFVFEALSTAAKMLLTAGSPTRHIILFADAADSEEPGAYRELLAKCAQENITVTVIGLGKDTDQDAELLRDIARRGGGRIFFTEDANELPRLFAQDTFIVARSAFVGEATAQRASGSLFTLTGRQFSAIPAIGGYNLTYLRNGASTAVLTEDDYHAPVVASWQAGSGRVLAYTGEIDGKFTGALAAWPQVGDYYTSLVRWVAGARAQLPADMLVTQQVVNGVNNITLQLDPERPSTRVTRTPRVTTLSGEPPAVTQADMTWRTPDELGIEVPLDGSATFLSTVDVPGVGRVTLPPVALPYSPELAPAAPGEGRAALERIARATGGKERIDVAGVWRDLPVRRHSIPLRMFLLLAAVLVLLVEVLERRMRVFSFSAETVERGASAPRKKQIRRAKARRSTVVEEEAPVPPPPPKPAEDNPLVDALQQAGKRARRRT